MNVLRDYIDVADLADAHVRALNLGTGHGHSVRDVIAAVERVTDRTVAAIEVDRRAGDPPRLMAATDLAALPLNLEDAQESRSDRGERMAMEARFRLTFPVCRA